MMQKKIHFIGIGGAGMAPLAELLLERGCRISGSDQEFNPKCAELQKHGAVICTGHRQENLPDDTELVVYSSAVPENNPERVKAQLLAISQLRRGEFLAEFAKLYKRVVAVSGSHGKSSITTLLAKILTECGKTPGFMIGAKVHGMPSYANGSGDDLFITEADESDGTHTLLGNALGIVPNIEDDHAWSLGGVPVLEKNFRTFAAHSQKLIYYASPECDKLFAGHPDALRLAEIPENFAALCGFQAVNAHLACQAAMLLGISEEDARNAVTEYPEVDRRMSIRCEEANLTVIEDYAHHPTEVRASLQWLRQRYPQRHLRVIFQPHRYARLARYFDEFAEVLKLADQVIVVPVFAAWSESGSVGSKELAEAIPNARYCDGSWRDCARETLRDLPRPAVIAVIGAGDVEKTSAELTALLKR